MGMKFIARVKGDYFVTGNQGNILRPYIVDVILPTWEKAQSFVRHHLMPKLLFQADPLFQGIRICIVESLTTMEGKPVPGLPLSLQSREQLTELIEVRDIPINPDMYPDVVQLRKRIQFALDKPEKFREEEKKNKRVYNRVTEALALNEEAFRSAQRLDQVQTVNIEPDGTSSIKNPSGTFITGDETKLNTDEGDIKVPDGNSVINVDVNTEGGKGDEIEEEELDF